VKKAVRKEQSYESVPGVTVKKAVRKEQSYESVVK
jgi:hypothetical protein